MGLLGKSKRFLGKMNRPLEEEVGNLIVWVWGPLLVSSGIGEGICGNPVPCGGFILR